jgi:hypothetical protein
MSPALIGRAAGRLDCGLGMSGRGYGANRRGPGALRALVKSEIARLTPIIAAASAKWVH